MIKIDAVDQEIEISEIVRVTEEAVLEIEQIEADRLKGSEVVTSTVVPKIVLIQSKITKVDVRGALPEENAVTVQYQMKDAQGPEATRKQIYQNFNPNCSTWLKTRKLSENLVLSHVPPASRFPQNQPQRDAVQAVLAVHRHVKAQKWNQFNGRTMSQAKFVNTAPNEDLKVTQMKIELERGTSADEIIDRGLIQERGIAPHYDIVHGHLVRRNALVQGLVRTFGVTRGHHVEIDPDHRQETSTVRKRLSSMRGIVIRNLPKMILMSSMKDREMRKLYAHH